MLTVHQLFRIRIFREGMKVNKKEYVSPEMEITEFATEDILIESNDDAVTPEMGF